MSLRSKLPRSDRRLSLVLGVGTMGSIFGSSLLGAMKCQRAAAIKDQFRESYQTSYGGRLDDEGSLMAGLRAFRILRRLRRLRPEPIALAGSGAESAAGDDVHAVGQDLQIDVAQRPELVGSRFEMKPGSPGRKQRARVRDDGALGGAGIEAIEAHDFPRLELDFARLANLEHDLPRAHD